MKTWCGREDLNLTEREIGGWTEAGLSGASHGLESSHPSHIEGDTQNPDYKNTTASDKSWTSECKPVTQQSTNRLQTIYQQSVAFVASILREPQLRRLLIAWQKTLGDEAKKQIAALASQH